MSRIIAIKLTDDWEKNEHIEANIKKTLEIWGGEIVTDVIRTAWASQIVPREQYSSSLMSDDFQEYIKKNIAVEIGIYAMENNLIKYTELLQNYGVEVSGKIAILNLKE